MAKRIYVGIDLGGTKIAAGLVSSRGKILRTHIIPTPSRKTVHGIVETMVDAIENLAGSRKKNLAGIGLGSAGPMNVETGFILNPTNFKKWKRVPLVQKLQQALRKRGFRAPISFQNDAMAASLGEGWVGAARGLKNYAVITVGTGIGTGVIFRGEPAQFAGMGSEYGLGILSLQNAKDTKKSWPASTEFYASGPGMVKRAQTMGFKGSTLPELILQSKKYPEIFQDAAWALAILCHNLSLGFHPQAIFFTGGVMHHEKLFFSQMKKNYLRLMRGNKLFIAPIKKATVGNHAGFLGAAYLAMKKRPF